MKNKLRLCAICIAIIITANSSLDVMAMTMNDKPQKYYTTDETGTIVSIVNNTGINLPTLIHDNSTIKKLIIPKNMEQLLSEDYYEIDPSYMRFSSSLTPNCPNLSVVTVDQNNKYYTCIDGVLYDKEMTKLFYCPPGKKGELVIPEGVKSIGLRSLQECAKLTSITIPSTLQGIGYGAFGGNTSLKEIKIAKGNKYLKSISNVIYSKDGEDLFVYAGGKTNKNYTIPSDVNFISSTAFMGCTNLQELTANKNLITVGSEAFRDCTNLKKVHFQKGLRELYAGSFYNCSKLEDLNLPEGTCKVYEDVFFGCKNLLNITIPKTMQDFWCDIWDVPNRIIKIYDPFISRYLYRDTVAEGITVYAYKDSYTASLVSKMKLKVNFFKDTYAPVTATVKVPDKVVKGKGKSDTSWFDKSKNELEINNPDQLAGLEKLVRENTDFSDKTIVLKKDLDLSCYPNWNPIGGGAQYGDYDTAYHEFNGNFDGGNHVIYNLRINRIGQSYQGLFGASNHPIKNLRLKKAEVIGGVCVGILSGYVTGSIINCSVNGTVYGDEYVGGIAGQNRALIQNCTADVNIYGNTGVGGITGGCTWGSDNSSGNLKSCSNSGTVTGNCDIGGIAGNTGSCSIEDCINTMVVTGNFNVGGIVGDDYMTNIISCTNKANVTGIDSVGGITGIYYISGDTNNCTNLGKISGVYKVGGIAGNMSVGTLHNCCNSGNINGTSEVGGIIGILGCVYPAYDRVFECSSTGKVKGKRYTDRIIGKDELALN